MAACRVISLVLCTLLCLQESSGLRRISSSSVASRYDSTSYPLLDRSNSARSDSDYFQFLQVSKQTTLERDISEAQGPKRQRPGIWPPWPFNLLSPNSKDSDALTASHPSLVLPFLQASTRAAILQTKVLASQLWLHAPPAAPPLVLLALLPQRRATVITAKGVSKRILTIPLFSNPFVRSIALGGAGLAVMSWTHAQLLRKRLLTPLPLAYKDINRAILPPFLPEIDYEDEVIVSEMDNDKRESLSNSSAVPKKLRKFLTKPSGVTFTDWRRMRREQIAQRRHRRRVDIMEQCMAIQKLKHHHSSGRKRDDANAELPLGYALVTGASKGLGRAIAVELARWGIPLILLARDLDRLTALAYDLEACYGIKCCVLQADLTKAGVAENIYQTTKKAGLQVDVLINNAGISSQGSMVDLPLTDVQSMVQLNVMSAATLTHLFGKEMKERKRGRILMVSSICGAVAGIPSVAIYSATKAFEKTLSLSIANELERFGVGVTCLLPGAISETGFRKSSKAQDALCWKIPFYARPPRQVAEAGVRALLLGDTEVMPGWMNRAFVRLMMPIVPQRIHDWVAEVMWSPVNLPLRRSRRQDAPLVSETQVEKVRPTRPRLKFQSAPRLLQIESSTKTVTPDESSTTEYPETDESDESTDLTESSSTHTKSDLSKSDLTEKQLADLLD
ncbi:hypothetical protein MPSEU_000886400 [Mayamaea pseudoterrestris]|nr:hypothetical protein MPSEU_000886400 [Mayamaea pseudoterrestris]